MILFQAENIYFYSPFEARALGFIIELYFFPGHCGNLPATRKGCILQQKFSAQNWTSRNLSTRDLSMDWSSQDRGQGWACRIEKLSNADISRLFRISKSISYRTSNIEYLNILKTSDFLSFFAENSPKIPKTHEPKSSTTTSPKIPKNRRKFWKFAENSLKRRSFLRPTYRIDIVSYRIKKPHIVSISYRVKKKRIAQGWSKPSNYRGKC